MSSDWKNNLSQLREQSDRITAERKQRLQELADAMKESRVKYGFIQLNFICTHNSRRSQISQVIAAAIASHLGLKDVRCFSGGTEATAFFHRSVTALREFGFPLESDDEKAGNPHFRIAGLEGDYFSKKFSDPVNPGKDFIAVMTCSEADASCPSVPGAFRRVSLPFRDPKESDATEEAPRRYRETVELIGRELHHAFALLL